MNAPQLVALHRWHLLAVIEASKRVTVYLCDIRTRERIGTKSVRNDHEAELFAQEWAATLGIDFADIEMQFS